MFAVIISFIFAVFVAFLIACVYRKEAVGWQIDSYCFQGNMKTPEFTVNNNVSIVFLAPVRNAMKGLPYFLSNIKRIKLVFPHTRIIFLENDSLDETKQFILDEFPDIVDTQLKHPLVAIDKNTPVMGRGCSRIERMSTLRNQLLTYVETTDDVVVMIDADWATNISISNFQKAITYLLSRSDINAVVPVFVSRPFYFPFTKFYFDTYAFKSEEFPDVRNGKGSQFKLQTKKWPQVDSIPVDSAFGSMAIYKRHAITHAMYNVIPTEKGCRCEHVSFNEQVGHIHLLPWFEIEA